MWVQKTEIFLLIDKSISDWLSELILAENFMWFFHLNLSLQELQTTWSFQINWHGWIQIHFWLWKTDAGVKFEPLVGIGETHWAHWILTFVPLTSFFIHFCEVTFVSFLRRNNLFLKYGVFYRFVGISKNCLHFWPFFTGIFLSLWFVLISTSYHVSVY